MIQYDDTDRAYLAALAAGEDTTAIEATMDAGDVARRERLHGPGALLAAALWYIEQGAPVFPLQPRGKKPLPGSHGLTEATLDTDQIRAWWKACPEFNIGIATGHAFDVIDFDGPHAIALGYAHLDWWPPIIGKVCTPRPGGNHWLTSPTAGAGNKTAMIEVPDCDCLPKRCAIDMRAMGGYVVAPPSRTDDRPGQFAGEYVWLTPLVAA